MVSEMLLYERVVVVPFNRFKDRKVTVLFNNILALNMKPSNVVNVISTAAMIGASIPLVSAETFIRSYPFSISHLSPLITYSPLSAWTINATSASTSEPDASMRIESVGRSLRVEGTGANVSVTYDPPPPGSVRSHRVGGRPGDELRSPVYFGSLTEGAPIMLRNWTGSLPGEGGIRHQLGGLRGGFMNVTSAFVRVPLPANRIQPSPSIEESEEA